MFNFFKSKYRILELNRGSHPVYAIQRKIYLFMWVWVDRDDDVRTRPWEIGSENQAREIVDNLKATYKVIYSD